MLLWHTTARPRDPQRTCLRRTAVCSSIPPSIAAHYLHLEGTRVGAIIVGGVIKATTYRRLFLVGGFLGRAIIGVGRLCLPVRYGLGLDLDNQGISVTSYGGVRLASTISVSNTLCLLLLYFSVYKAGHVIIKPSYTKVGLRFRPTINPGVGVLIVV